LLILLSQRRTPAFGQWRTVKATADPKLRCHLKHAVIGYIRRNYYLEFIVSAYIPALIWVLSGMACHLIAKRRLLKRTVLRHHSRSDMSVFYSVGSHCKARKSLAGPAQGLGWASVMVGGGLS
jgi:hypothetical protein